MECDEPIHSVWAFVVAGKLPLELRDAGNLTVSVHNVDRNIRSEQSLSCSEGTEWKQSPTSNTEFFITFVNANRRAVVEVNDRLLIEVTDADGRLVAEKQVTIVPAELANAYKLVTICYNPIPEKTALLQNYPNPFNPETWLPYRLAQEAPVTIHIYNIKGQLIRSLHLSNQKAGTYTTKERAAYWDGKNATGQAVSSGVYFYQLQIEDFSEKPGEPASWFTFHPIEKLRAVRKMVIVK